MRFHSWIVSGGELILCQSHSGLNNMKLPNLSELKRVSPCGDENYERRYDEAVQSIMKNRDQ